MKPYLKFIALVSFLSTNVYVYLLCGKCEENIAAVFEHDDMLCDKIEILREFTHLIEYTHILNVKLLWLMELIFGCLMNVVSYYVGKISVKA